MKTYNALCNYVDFLNVTCNYLEGLQRYSDLSNYEGYGYKELREMFTHDLFQLDLRNILIKNMPLLSDNAFNFIFDGNKK